MKCAPLRAKSLPSLFAALPSGFFSIEPYWEARAAGAGAMIVAAAGALTYHLRASLADRRAVLIRGRAAELRQLALYALVVVGLFFAAFSSAFTVQGLWDRIVADGLVPLERGFAFSPVPPRGPTRDDALRFQLLGQIPPIVAGLTLWLATWLPLQRGTRAAGPDGDVERRSVARKLAIYLVVGVSAVTVLIVRRGRVFASFQSRRE